jgi:hypothetical protein
MRSASPQTWRPTYAAGSTTAREHFVAIYLDGRQRPVADCVVSIGTATASLVHPREVFQPAIAVGACALLIGHNHPSGDPTRPHCLCECAAGRESPGRGSLRVAAAARAIPASIPRNDGRLFVAANHWPRAWYHRALENPEISVTRNGETTDYRAVPVSQEERVRLLDESEFPLVAYVFTGFAPRQFLRLDPR